MKSYSPFGEEFFYELNNEKEIIKINSFINNNRRNVIIQGLGFVGTAMAAALSAAKNNEGKVLFNVIGVDLPDEKNYWKIGLINRFKPPVVSTDNTLFEAYRNAETNGNLLATYSDHAFTVADIVIIDIHLDIKKSALGNVYDYSFTYKNYINALQVAADKVKEGVLIIVETTVPPGTTEKVIYPLFKKAFAKRCLDTSKLYIAHSYERVMPGPKYYDSIVNFYRVFASINEASKEKTRSFLESFINVEDYPLTELHSTTASEISKVLENSFRAMNIAFIKEWTDFAQKADVNLFDVIDAIRVRPTHRNIMQPGFGVGGYCLTKDALLADWAYQNHFGNQNHLEMSINAISTNDLMPEYTFELLKQSINSLKDKNIAIFGVSYLSDVSDTRYSPTEYFHSLCKKEGANVNVYDPLVSYWEEKNISIENKLDSIKDSKIQIAVFTVKHKEYFELNSDKILELMNNLEVLIDANNVINDQVAKELKDKDVKIIGVGKGHWNNF